MTGWSSLLNPFTLFSTGGAGWTVGTTKPIYPLFQQADKLDCQDYKTHLPLNTHKSGQKKFGETELPKTAERSEDVENNCVFSSFFGTFFLLWLANKEEKKDMDYL
ncbi:MAG: hypothetical protein E7Z89_07200 [Cyanobacteria bacterium SIG28]|nr:hypothetical protein [Cyanobacteria bacterium SIG28]